ncbi:MAG: TatD family hydrolase [Candidatus Microsaccharimonas sp.]
MLVDTHAHIHESIFEPDALEAIDRARTDEVTNIICVGTSEESSRQAIDFANGKEGIFASIGVHPHDTKDGYGDIEALAGSNDKIIAVGEIGLDYFYTNSPKETQIAALESQIETALAHDLPIIFHVREAFDDFWPIFEKYKGIRGVLHSFTDTQAQLDRALAHGLYIGVNGISTFTKDEAQRAMFDAIPLDRLLLETDAPFLTPSPFRGKINEPAFVRIVAEYHAERRGISVEEIAKATSANVHALFAI